MSYATLAKEFTFDAAHSLPNSDGPCRRLHGHTYRAVVFARGQKDRAHPAMPELAHDTIGTDEHPLPFRVGGVDEIPDRLLQKTGRGVVLFEQALDLGTKRGIATVVEQWSPVIGRYFYRRVKQRSDAFPEGSVDLFRGHW